MPGRERGGPAVAIVTGAASGIGRACSLELARRGTAVAVVDVDEVGARAVVERIRDLGGRAEAYVADVAQRDQLEAAVESTEAALGPIDLGFSNAGVCVAAPVVRMRREDWKWIVDVNLWGSVNAAELLLPRFLARGRGHLAFTASIAGLVGAPSMAAYSLTKFGVVGFAEALRLEVEHRGVDITTVCPGFVHTNLAQATRYRNEGFERFLMAPPGWYGLDVDAAARTIVDGLARRRSVVAFGPERAGWWLKRISPELAFRLTRWVARSRGLIG